MQTIYHFEDDNNYIRLDHIEGNTFHLSTSHAITGVRFVSHRTAATTFQLDAIIDIQVAAYACGLHRHEVHAILEAFSNHAIAEQFGLAITKEIDTSNLQKSLS